MLQHIYLDLQVLSTCLPVYIIEYDKLFPPEVFTGEEFSQWTKTLITKAKFLILQALDWSAKGRGISLPRESAY